MNKPVGMTSHRMAMGLSKSYKRVVSHTGSLDPMAKGVMIFLIGAGARSIQARWQEMNKEYEFEVIFGFSTDSHDVLGFVENVIQYKNKFVTTIKLKNILNKWKGSLKLPCPVFSHRVIRGKPLYWWARQGRLSEIKIPELEVKIHQVKLLGIRTISKEWFRTRIKKKIGLIEGDFRQQAILEKWGTSLDETQNKCFTIASVWVSCGKGTYVRSLAHHLGESLGIPSLAYSITRTRNGPFRLKDCLE